MILPNRAGAALAIAAMLQATSTHPSTQPPAPDPHANSAIVPVSRSDEPWWQARFESANQRAKQGNIDLVFIGDSITQGWEGEGKDIWQQRFAARKPLNLGFSGDLTQHVLWRLDHGNVDRISPTVAVVMIGTNNCGANSGHEIAAGITQIVQRLRSKLPDTNVLLLGILPRGEQPNSLRDKINEVNAIIAKLDDGKRLFYLDIGSKFVRDDGSISSQIMPDFLHLSPKGYEIWADAIEPKLAQLMRPHSK